MPSAVRALALPFTIALLAAACGDGGEATDRTFTATSIEGEDVALADYAGQDVLLWFWAPW